ncbi:hypothetical protein V5799_016148 [Amblyomma americanum]|uniref:Uncharacterized protein n=1 Tax=Amblyomma americanum TaxID=6943 RepID=A0AAQ4F6M2_AMBAM
MGTEHSGNLDFQKAFPPGPKFLVDFENIYFQLDSTDDRCLLLQRRPRKPNMLRIEFYDGTVTLSTFATLLFSSSTHTVSQDQVYVAAVRDVRLAWIQTGGEPYKLLFYDGQKCMVVKIPSSKAPEETKKIKEPPGETGQCTSGRIL